MLIVSITIPGAFGQASAGLHIGDRVPDMQFSLLNAKSKQVALSDYKGKAVILDFWATWCSSCISQFPKMDSLQVLFGDRVKILLVNSRSTGDDVKKIGDFFEKRKRLYGKGFGLETAFNDVLADSLFRHSSIPHYVWIDKNGIIKAITSAMAVTAINVEKLITGQALALKEKDDIKDQEFMASYFLPDSNVKYKSLFTGPFTAVVPNGFSRSHIFYPNLSLIKMFQIACRYHVPRSRLIIEGEIPSGDYCYELVLPGADKPELLKHFQTELEHFSGVKASIEKRMLPCLILTRDMHKKPRKRGSTNVVKPGSTYSVGAVLDVLNNNLTLGKHFVDETNDSAPHYNDPHLLDSLADVQIFMKNNGVILKEEQREVEVLVLNSKLRYK